MKNPVERVDSSEIVSPQACEDESILPFILGAKLEEKIYQFRFQIIEKDNLKIGQKVIVQSDNGEFFFGEVDAFIFQNISYTSNRTGEGQFELIGIVLKKPNSFFKRTKSIYFKGENVTIVLCNEKPCREG